jgi:translocator protein
MPSRSSNEVPGYYRRLKRIEDEADRAGRRAQADRDQRADQLAFHWTTRSVIPNVMHQSSGLRRYVGPCQSAWWTCLRDPTRSRRRYHASCSVRNAVTSPAAVVGTDSQRAAARDADPLMSTNAPATPVRPGHRIAVAAVTLAVVAISALGGLGVNTDSAWYQSLALPSWQPPGWLFGPVWTVLYILLARSAYLAWRDADGPRRAPILALYAANAILNVGWTYLFFRAERPALAGVEILVLLATIVALVVLMRPVNRQASWALVPYGAWVAFATALTWTITAAN